MDTKLTPDLTNELNKKEAETGLNELTDQVKHLKKRLSISDKQARSIKEQFDIAFETAKDGVAMVGGSEEELAKLWGFTLGGIIYEYLANRESEEGRRALSFIRMQMGYEINNRIGSEMQFGSFVLGLSLRFMKGFEKLKNNLNEIEEALVKFKQNNYVPKPEIKENFTDMFGRDKNTISKR
jgi:hypothetical protein